MTSEAVEVFFSYSHKDEDLRDELATHLAMLKNQGLIKAWHDREISAGTEWADAIDENLNSADVILLLVSANFLASQYCYDIEMKRAMERHEAGETRVIPIILKPVDWSGATFGKLQALPKNAKPITTWSNPDEAFLNVAQGIRRVVEEIAKGKAGDEGSETLKQPIVPVTEPQPTLKTQPFKFEVATVSIKSGSLEINRSRGRAEFFTEDLGNGIILEMVQISGGIFVMGSPESEEERRESEGPQHLVSIKPFFMGKYPVTQAQWFAVAASSKVERDLDPNPARFKGVHRPVEQVSWYDAVEFCQRLSRKTGRSYRLPSEAEWEYACRAGTTTPFHFGETITTNLANYRGTDWEYEGKTYPGSYGYGPRGEYRKETTPVGSFPPNAFGLYDMHGNVWEWCADPWHDNYNSAPSDGSVWESGGNDEYRVLRGGSWYHPPGLCRSACRFYVIPVNAHDDFGFRVVCVPARTL